MYGVADVCHVSGNFIGVFLTPVLLRGYLGKAGQAPFTEVFKQLAITIIAPVIVGQIFHILTPQWVEKAKKKINFSNISSFMIVLLVWASFCNTFSKHIHADAGSIVSVLFLDFGMFSFFSFMSFGLAWSPPLRRLCGFERGDVVAVVMCAATKTLALGVPMINVLYKDNPSAGLLALPLIIYHALQVLFGSLLVRPMRYWNNLDKEQQGEARAAVSTEETRRENDA